MSLSYPVRWQGHRRVCGIMTLAPAPPPMSLRSPGGRWAAMGRMWCHAQRLGFILFPGHWRVAPALRRLGHPLDFVSGDRPLGHRCMDSHGTG
jgi:hypothetical protein